MSPSTPAVLPASQTRPALKAGFDQMARLLASTLGPHRGVVFHYEARKQEIEPLTDAATIARRVVALPNRAEDVGAMLLRSLAWRVHQRVGDGCATTAVLAQAILEQGYRLVVAGANPMRVQSGLQKAARRALDSLQVMAQPVSQVSELNAIAFTATAEPELSLALGEMLFRLGPQAYLQIEEYLAAYLEKDYVEGGLWKAQSISPHLVNDPFNRRSFTRNCNVVLYNGNVNQPEEILPLIQLLAQSERKNLLLAAQKLEGQAASALVATCVQNRERVGLEFVLVNMVRAGENALRDLQDLAALTGAKLFDPLAGDSLRTIRPADLGFAEYAEVVEDRLRVSGGGGEPLTVQARIDALQAYLNELPFDDKNRDEVEMRIGRLAGRMGILKIGADTHHEREVLRQKAEKGMRAVRAAQKSGLVPGGGTAYLHCIPALQALTDVEDEERMGVMALAHALHRPFEQLLLNAGIEHPARLAQEILQSPPGGLVFDVEERQLCAAQEIGLYDPAAALMVALETAVSGAQMALSTEVMVLKKNPRVSYEP
ncbi:MAG: TCP-1/cpn60 chaperonin family protein [Anaerolineales bacterium]|nr:TCP-1/cpn60 chaperonin family protein [Anaerolineales bacterium]